MKGFLTVASRWRPASLEWEYKNVVSSKPPEAWLMERIEAEKLVPYGRQELCILYAREIPDDVAAALEEALHEKSQKF